MPFVGETRKTKKIKYYYIYAQHARAHIVRFMYNSFTKNATFE